MEALRTILISAMILSAPTLSAQSVPDRPASEAALSAEQKTRVKAILSRYDAAALDAKSARAINDAFRAAGLRNGPGLIEAIREAGFSPERLGQLDPPPDRPAARSSESPGAQDEGGGERPEGSRPERSTKRRPPDRPQAGRGGGYSIEQATSDRAQLNTIAFDGLAFLTGAAGCNTFLPPGKVADFSGFQYMRDVDRNELGHNTSFVPRAANNMLHILTAEQKAQLVALAREQEPQLTDFAYKRFPLIAAFDRQRGGDLPKGSAGLSREAVMKYTGELYQLDGWLSYRRAEVLGGIVRSLTQAQKDYLGRMAFNNSATWPDLPDQVDRRDLSPTAHVAVMTYASEMFSWYAGSVEADTYFCPERHATYFGSFYMKDIKAMGNPNYSISASLTGDAGEAFLAALSEPQRRLVTQLVDQQRTALARIVETRRSIATELRRFMKEPSADKAKVLALSKGYGELDGEISYLYAKALTAVARTLTPEQKQKLAKLRNLDARYDCKSAYLYSRPIDMPAIPNTDFLFAVGAAARPVGPGEPGF